MDRPIGQKMVEILSLEGTDSEETTQRMNAKVGEFLVENEIVDFEITVQARTVGGNGWGFLFVITVTITYVV